MVRLLITRSGADKLTHISISLAASATDYAPSASVAGDPTQTRLATYGISLRYLVDASSNWGRSRKQPAPL